MAQDITPQGRPGEVVDIVVWNADGLAPVVTQQHDTGEVLMFAWADKAALLHTLESRRATYFSRSRGGQWVKGESSGNAQAVVEVRVDCDGDVILYRVDSPGPACHQLRRSCFSHRVESDGSVHTDRPIL
ncbi:MAG: phosphoribosyl-AMP cyclohydrolase [Planctomycetota bacterium]|nr:MAG: phosphoribosyl-AMP cyclohydrolase [Planctomycetota bacterium]